MSRARLPDEQIRAKVDELNEGLAAPWGLRDGKLHKAFAFPDFVRAFGFMTQAALVAEAMDHHPEWANVYRHVTVDLSTHDAGGLTELDFALAARMERLAGGA